MHPTRILTLWILLFTGVTLELGRFLPTTRAEQDAVASERLDLDKVWRDFRNAFPFLMQSVAVQRGKDGESVLIVSEPPPQVTEDQLRKLLPSVKFKKHVLGADGWVKDAVAVLHLSDKEVRELVAELHELMYSTAYKSSAIELPFKMPVAPTRQPDELRLAPDAGQSHYEPPELPRRTWSK